MSEIKSNIAYIYQPHFNTQKARVSIANQRGDDYNFVVITCSPMFNGVYRYPISKIPSFGRIYNGKLPCYEVPISDLDFVCSLENIKGEERKSAVVEQQTKWFKSEVRNRDYIYEEIPEWMLPESKSKLSKFAKKS